MCPRHKQMSIDRKKKRDRERGSAAARGYDETWRRTRASYIKAKRVCEWDGCSDPIDEVHHKMPLAEGGARLDWGNLQGLCRHHHSSITANRERDEQGRWL